MFVRPLFTKKTFYHNFFLTKEEEEREKERPEAGRGGHDRVLAEIRDINPPPVVDPNNPWVIKKILNHDEVDSGKLVLTQLDTFEHVLRYWPFDCANYIAVGLELSVAIWDVTQEKNPRKYDGGDAYMRMGEGDDFYLICKALVKDRNLKVYDEIGLYWDVDKACLMFRLLLDSV